MEQQQRLLLAFALSILLWLAYDQLVLRRYQSEAPPVEPTSGAHPESIAPVRPEAGTPAPTPVPSETPLAAPVSGAPSFTVDTDVFEATITAQGGRLQSLRLKGYRQSVDQGSPPLELVRAGDLLPVTMRLTDGQSDASVRYEADATTVTVNGEEGRSLTLRGALADGRHIEKRLTFRGNTYAFDVSAKVDSGASSGLAITAIASDNPQTTASETAIALQGRNLVSHAVGTITARLDVPDVTWAGFSTHYFVMAVLPADDGRAVALFEKVGDHPLLTIDGRQDQPASTYVVYAGPKDEAELDRAGHDLGRVLNFGWFWFAAIPLLHALRFLHRLTGNYGLAIILLTTAVKVVTIPLTQTTFRNMREMQKIQPQMKKLQERFKDDQAALQKEMMELYRRHRVNPLSGCLPMILQLPIFVGLYNALSSAIELRHAPFALWIKDLASPDRLVVAGVGIPVLTLLMGGSMLLQQWLSPQQGDPAQQRIMMLMPLVFTFMFINLPAGLVLYWLVNNVLTIAQQYWMLRSGK